MCRSQHHISCFTSPCFKLSFQNFMCYCIYEKWSIPIDCIDSRGFLICLHNEIVVKINQESSFSVATMCLDRKPWKGSIKRNFQCFFSSLSPLFPIKFLSLFTRFCQRKKKSSNKSLRLISHQKLKKVFSKNAES